MKIFLPTEINNNLHSTFGLFNEDLFKALKPPAVELNVLKFDGCKKGDEVHLEISFGPLKQKWISLITDDLISDDVCFFIDEGKKLPPPLKSWKHIHRIRKIDDHNCVIEDDIEYSTGNSILDRLIYPILYAQFKTRKPVYQKLLNKNN